MGAFETERTTNETKVSSACMENYNRFVSMSRDELNGLQQQYYAELQELQDELDRLLDELRSEYQLCGAPLLKSA